MLDPAACRFPGECRWLEAAAHALTCLAWGRPEIASVVDRAQRVIPWQAHLLACFCLLNSSLEGCTSASSQGMAVAQSGSQGGWTGSKSTRDRRCLQFCVCRER